MSPADLYLPHWIGLLDALGVMLAFVVWWLVTDERWDDVRPAVAAGGGLLLVVAVAGVLARLSGQVGRLTLPDRYDGTPHGVADLVVLAVAGVVGLWAATQVLGPDEEPALDEETDEEADDADDAPAAPAVPARAWSGTEVLGGDAEEEDDDPWRPAPPEWVRERRAGARGVGVPLIAIAVALGLPARAYLGLGPAGLFGSVVVTRYVGAVEVFSHLVDGLLLGGALLGAALALDLWERRAAVLAFTLLAFGTGLLNGFPRAVNNRWWSALGIGLAAGLVAPGALRALRRSDRPGRLATLLGVVGALALIVAAAYLTTRAATIGFTSYSSAG
jgi:hypothetical protein